MKNIVIWSKEGCTYCEAAINLAKYKGLNVKILKLDVDYEVEDFNTHFPYANAVPQIILDGKHIGGYQEFKDLVN
jgi:glutaredoxin